MALGKLKPKFFRLVQKPSNAAASELAKATPIYIEGLVAASVVEALAARVKALEDAADAAA